MKITQRYLVSEVLRQIEETPAPRPNNKQFTVRIGIPSNEDLVDIVYLYGRERLFAPNGQMSEGPNAKFGLMVQNIKFASNFQGQGLFDKLIATYQNKYPNRLVYIQCVSNNKWARKLESSNNPWQRTIDWDLFSRNYWLPSLAD